MDQQLPKFQVYAKRKNAKQKRAHIYMRISYQTDVLEKSLGIECLYNAWQPNSESIKNDPVLTHHLKEKLLMVRQKIMGAFYILKQSAEEVSLQEVMAVALEEKKSRVFSVYSCFEDLVGKMIKSKGNGTTHSNIQKHQVCLRHLRAFVSKEYGWNDFPFDRINRSFIDAFVDYLRTEAECSHNTSMKHLAIFKKIYKLAMDNHWVKNNAFSGYRMRLKIVDRAYLSEEEIEHISQKIMHIKRLDQIRDLFVFACFTGLAYIDLKNLKRRNIEENLGISWIKIKREKTGVEATIPLLPPARKILIKWNPCWHSQSPDDLLFNVPSNQKTNAYLKEIADICGITKPLSFHIGRHSFATSIALCNNIPMETVSKMLGHSRISMTQHYSKVIDLKIAKDSNFLFNKYASPKIDTK